MTLTDEERDEQRRMAAAEEQKVKDALARGVFIAPITAKTNRLQQKLLLLKTIARNVSQTPILTKRTTPNNNELVDNEDLAGDETTAYSALIRIFVSPEDLPEERR